MIRPDIWRRELAIPFQSLQTELNRLFDDYLRPATHPGSPVGTSEPAETAGGATDKIPSAWTPAIDLWDSPTEMILRVDLPGVDPASINLSLAGSVLSLRGVKLAAKLGPEAPSAPTSAPRCRVQERPAGAFHREVTLSDEVDLDQVEAQTKDGVLTVRLPKRATTPSRTIPIQVA